MLIDKQTSHFEVSYRVPAHAGMMMVSLVLFTAAGTLISIVLGTLRTTGLLNITWLVVLMPILVVLVFFVTFSVITMLGVAIYVLVMAIVYKTKDWKEHGCRLGR